MTSWLAVWSRAVLVTAARRVAPAWIGCAIVGGLVFGPTALQPRDVTMLALAHAEIGAVLAVTWLLVFLPTARVLVRADDAAYLRALPRPAVPPGVLAVAALVGLQLPWLALWILGDGARGLAVVVASTIVIAALAAWRPPRGRLRVPAWRSGAGALTGVQLRGLGRRAGDALIRGTGLALLAGGAAGLFVRNNALDGAGAATLGASVIAVVSVPAAAGPLLAVLDAHRASGWLAATLGVAPSARMLALVVTLAALQLAIAALGVVAAALVARPDLATFASLGATSLAIALGTALVHARILVGSEARADAPSRIVGGAIAVAAIAAVCLGLFGVAGVLAFGALGVLAIATVPG